MPRAPSDLPPIPSGPEAAMLFGSDSDTPLAQYVRSWEPSTIDHQARFHEELRAMLHHYVDEADSLAQKNLRDKIHDEHATGLDS